MSLAPLTQPTQLLRAVWTLVPSFAGTQQQDAHEFTRFLLERLRLEFVRGGELAAAAASSKASRGGSPRHQPREREHGEGSVVMMDLGIPNPLRRTRSLRGGQRKISGGQGGGGWSSDGDGATTPPERPSPRVGEKAAGSLPASPTAIKASLNAAAASKATAAASSETPLLPGVPVGEHKSGSAPGSWETGFVIVSRWGAVTHKLGCTCRPCKSRRKATAGGGDSAVKKSDAPANDPAVGLLPGRSVSRSEIERLTARASPRGLPASPSPLGFTKMERTEEVAARKRETEPAAASAASPDASQQPSPSAPSTDSAEAGPAPRLGDANGLDDAGLPTDPVWRLFGGVALSRIRCTRCGHASTRREPFLDISLPIPQLRGGRHGSLTPTTSPGSPRAGGGTSASAVSPDPLSPVFGDGANGGGVSLAQCLAAHTRDETLSGAGRYYCERCADVGGATKQTKLQTLPPVLCLHLKRFTWRGGGSKTKIDAHVDFPLDALDLSPYLETREDEEGEEDLPSGKKSGGGAARGRKSGVTSGDPGPTGRAAAETAAAAAAAAAEMAAAASEAAKAHATGPNGGSGSGATTPRTRRNSSGALDAAAQDAAAAKAAAAEEAAEQAREAAAVAMASWIDRSGSDDPEGAGPPLYDLAAAVVHHGPGAGSGHYTVYARDDDEDGGGVKGRGQTGKDAVERKSTAGRASRWRHFNDEKVLEASGTEVKAAGGYLFFYVRRQTNTATEGKRRRG